MIASFHSLISTLQTYSEITNEYAVIINKFYLLILASSGPENDYYQTKTRFFAPFHCKLSSENPQHNIFLMLVFIPRSLEALTGRNLVQIMQIRVFHHPVLQQMEPSHNIKFQTDTLSFGFIFYKKIEFG